MERHIPLKGAKNFRDLGGYPGQDGRRVRWRRVFRADALHALTARDVQVLRTVGLARVVDLRTPWEVERFGAGMLTAHGVEHLHLPFVADTAQPGGELAGTPATLEEADQERVAGYLWMLEQAGPTVSRVFSLLAHDAREDGAGGGLVFHCTSGKDRTGILAALLLRALGVSAEAVAGDYALTARYLVRTPEEIRALEATFGLRTTAEMREPRPRIMRGLLAGLDATYGSVPAYLATVGIDAGAISRLQAALLADPDTSGR